MDHLLVDLRSDTITRPTPTMRDAMAAAEVGDDVFGEDPTVNRLEEEVARRFGKEAAVYVPSGTMANQLAVHSLTQPGDEVLVERDCHIFNHESGAAAVLSGVLLRQLSGEHGVITADQVLASLRPEDDHHAPVTLVTAENTHNRSGGSIFPLDILRNLRLVTEERGIALHIDGARIFNASVATGIPLADYGSLCDTISCCFSKALGAPVGSALAGSTATIRRARRMRKMLGGGMRQAGILAAGALHALDHHVDRLAQDHARARRLASGLRSLAGFGVRNDPPDTNMVIVTVEAPRTAEQVCRDLASHDVHTFDVSATEIRLVVHLELDDRHIDRTLEAFEAVASS